MHAETRVAIAAPPERVWAVMTDVEAWPQWTSSVTSVQLLDDRPLRVGSRARIRQPLLPTTMWRVTELVEGRAFTWVALGPGSRVTARHSVEADAAGSVVTLSIDQSGPVGAVFGRLSARLTRRYLQLEAEGLRSWSAAGSAR